MKDQLRREIPQFIDNLPKDFSLSFFLPFPKSYSQKKRDKLRGQPHELKPDLVLVPSLNDIHQDHCTIAQEGLRAFKNTTILGYELIWNNLTFDTTSFVTLDKKHIQSKCDALKEYKSQEQRDYMSEEFIFSLARTRGVQIGAQYAESFEVIRWVM